MVLYEIDKKVTGEDRQCLLSKYINNAYIYKEKNLVKGYYIKEMEDGPIIALDEIAGKELLKVRSKFSTVFTLPVDNVKGIEFLKSIGYKETKRAKRMVYGKKNYCQFENIYNRIGGNFG